jgi:TonB family protein
VSMVLRSREARLLCLASALYFFSFSANAAQSCTSVAYKSMHPPKYPPEAVAERVEGKAFVQVVVEKDGIPSNIVMQKSSGNLALDQAAIAAVRDWRFEPSRCGGEAVQSAVVLPVDFALTDQDAPKSLSILADNEPMEFSDPATAPEYLKSRRDVVEMPGSDPGHRLFRNQSNTRLWFVDKAKGSRALTVSRWREVAGSGQRVGRVAFECSGPKSFCVEMQQSMIDFFTRHPPPPPPLSPEAKPLGER